MIDLEVKQYIREFIEMKLQEGRIKMPFGSEPVFYIKKSDAEKFIDDLWVSINIKKMNNEK